jgi:RNA polymerase sigma factor (sigma-70 family)
VVSNYLKQTDLDEKLSLLAQHPESYDHRVREHADSIDGLGLDLEIVDPADWRREDVGKRRSSPGSIEEQFRTEVDRILTQDREEEARLARRIEFARIRLEQAVERAGLDPEDLSGRAPSLPGGEGAPHPGESVFPDEVVARWRELHALRTELVERNLYLVLINVERYSHSKVSRMDLVQEGASALFRAVDGFDWRRGLLFRTYAVHWLNQAFRSLLYNFGSTVRVPVYLQKALKHINEAIDRLGSSASVDDIASETDLGPSVVASALGARRATHSIDTAFGDGDGEGSALRDLLTEESEDGPYDPSMEELSAAEGVEIALERLGKRERYVIGLRFGLGGHHEHTLAEIAAILGVSLERVRQIQVRAISKMNTPNLRRAVDPFLA